MEQASCHPAGIQNFQSTSRFFGKVVHPWLSGWEYILSSVSSQCITIQAMIILHFHLQIIKDGIARTKDVNTKLGSWDLVTQYDKRVEEVLVRQISEKFSSHK